MPHGKPRMAWLVALAGAVWVAVSATAALAQEPPALDQRCRHEKFLSCLEGITLSYGALVCRDTIDFESPPCRSKLVSSFGAYCDWPNNAAILDCIPAAVNMKR